MIVSESEYVEATDCSMGFCVGCGSFTRGCTEPDAEGCDCPECGELSVMGAEQALLTGTIDIGGM